MHALSHGYRKKFPGAHVNVSDHGLDVYHGSRHLVSLRKNGAGIIVDQSEQVGCEYQHSLSGPFPHPDFKEEHKAHKKILLDKKRRAEVEEIKRAEAEKALKENPIQDDEE